MSCPLYAPESLCWGATVQNISAGGIGLTLCYPFKPGAYLDVDFGQEEAIDEVVGQSIMPNEESHVDGAVKRIEKQIEIGALSQLTTADAPAKDSVGIAASRPHKTITKSGDQFAVGLTGGKNGGENPALTAGKNLYYLTHLTAQIDLQRTGVGKTKFGSDAVGEGIGDDGAFVWPPAIDRSLADFRTIGNSLDGQLRKAALPEELQGAAQDGLVRSFTAGTARGTFPIVILVVRRKLRLLAHSLTLPYNRQR